MPTDAVIFDAYGTLVLPTLQTARVVRRAGAPPLRALLAALGELTDERRETVRQLTLVRPLATMRDAAKLLEQELGRPVPAALVDEQQVVLGKQLATFVLRDGTLETLDALRAKGVRLALLSNLASPYQEPIRRLGLEAKVDVAVYSCDVGLAKPDPAIFRLTLARLGVADPARALMVGDREDLDAQGAEGAGLRALTFGRKRPLGELLGLLE
jgi:HAD superfamily hydrolase (TIGR01509 family)